MKSGVTSSGFPFEFDERNADDMRFVDLIAETMSEDASEFDKIYAASKLLSMLLGEDQKKRLYDHIGQSYNGRVPYADLEKALAEIMQGGGETVKK